MCYWVWSPKGSPPTVLAGFWSSSSSWGGQSVNVCRQLYIRVRLKPPSHCSTAGSCSSPSSSGSCLISITSRTSSSSSCHWNRYCCRSARALSGCTRVGGRGTLGSLLARFSCALGRGNVSGFSYAWSIFSNLMLGKQ